MKITLKQYFGAKPRTQEHENAAQDLLTRVNSLVREAESANAFQFTIDPDTESCISGARNGAGDGGFRTAYSSTGSKRSAHREAMAVDVYDPANALDDWLGVYDNSLGGNTKLEEYGLYREHPDFTVGWCHLTTRPPGSKRRTFNP